MAGTVAATTGRRRTRTQAFLRELPLLVLLAAFVALMLPGFADPGDVFDEGFALAYGDFVRHGLVAQRDFESFYGPGGPWLVAGMYSVFGTSLATERALGLVYLVLVVSGGAAFARMVGGRPAGIGAAFVLVVLLSPASLLAAPVFGALGFALWSSALLVIATDRESPPFAVAAGLAGGASIVLRPDFAPAVVAAAVFVLWRARGAPRPFALGMTVPVAALVVHAAVVGPDKLGRVIGDWARSGPARRLPIPSVLNTDPGHILALTVVFLVIAAALALHRRDRSLAALAALCALLLPYGLSRASTGHLVVPAVPALVAASLVLTRVRRFLLVAPAVIVLAWFTAADERLHDRITGVATSGVLVRNQGRAFRSDADHVADLRAVLVLTDRLSRPGDRLFVGPRDLRRTPFNDAELYWLLPQLRPATYYVELNPGAADRKGSLLPAQLPRARILILNSEWDGWDEPNDSRTFGPPAANDVVARLFCKRGSAGTFTVFVRCRR